MTALAETLIAAGVADGVPDLYGFLIGRWALEVRHYAGVDLAGQGVTGELHASRVLDGRGVQDTWIMPVRGQRAAITAGRNMYGTTLRIWDPAVEGWRITWINPAGNHTEQQLGRARGADVVQLGMRPSGVVTRWMFTSITPTSFHWLGDALATDGETWRREGEFLGTRL